MKKIIYLLVISLIIISVLGPLSALAEGETPTPKIYAEDRTVTAGNHVYVYVYASDLEAVGALEIYAFYDPEIFSLEWADERWLVSGEQTVINTSTPGEICFNMISADGVSGSGEIFEMCFYVDPEAKASTHTVTLAVGNAFDKDLNPISFDTDSPRITVEPRPAYLKSLYFYDWNYGYTYRQGDEVEVYFALNDAQGLASIDFELEYDKKLLSFEGVSLGYELKEADNALHSVNSTIPGYVKVSYASTARFTGYIGPIITYRFKVIGNVDGNTEVILKPSGIYDADLNPMTGNSVTHYIDLDKIEEAPDLPKISVSDFDGTDESFDISITAPGSTGLAAIDFEINFDSTKIACTGAVCEADNCFIINNIDNEKGLIKFSFICEEGISADTELVKLSFSRAGLSGGCLSLNVIGKNAVDADFKSIELEYESPTLYCHVLGSEPTCTEPQVCTICSKVFLPPLGHDEIPHDAKAPSCTEIGWNSYVTCSRCDYTTYKELAILPHPTVRHDAKEPTCTDIGWDEYETCTVCSYTTYVELAPLGHRVLVDGRIWVDSVSFENDPNYPFDFVDGTYISTNHDHNSVSTFTIRAEYDCTLGISYLISSEQYCDRVVILHNGSHIHEDSGLGIGGGITLGLLAGDIVTISYHKDVSVNTDTDDVRFSLNCTQTEVGAIVPVPAEQREPTCTEAVICSFCNTTIKEALGHDYVDHEGQTVTCTEIGWDAYKTCNRCDYSSYAEIGALGHDEIFHKAQDPTCTEVGWYDYVTCSRCDYTTYVELAPLGHRVLVDGRIWVDSVSFENDPNYPFDFVDGRYVSTNHIDNSSSTFTITAAYECTLYITYSVSSEENFDWIIINQNGYEVLRLSGIQGDNELTLGLLAGDVVTVSYSKDGSVNNGDDAISFSFTSTQTEIGGIVTVPAEQREPTCTEAVICSFCNTTIKEALGHDYVDHEGQAVSCTKYGWDAYKTCNRCDYSSYAEIPALGHDKIFHPAKESTCTEVGWYDYVTCSRCDYTTYVELAPLGHRVLVDGRIWVDSISYENDPNYPFEFVDGTYISTNHDHNSVSTFTIRAEYDCTLGISYLISSEQYCDRVVILHNGSHIHEDSGLGIGGGVTLGLLAGDIVTISYHKDGSVNTDTDDVRFSLNCTQTEVGAIISVPAEQREPTCTEAVICSFCITTIKEALGHDYVDHEGKTATCTEIGWDAYKTCNRCDYSSYAEIGALGHDEIYHMAQDPTCTEIGWYDYVTCSRCDYSTYKEITAFGHTSSGWIIDLDPTYEADGRKHKECTTCGEILEESTIPMLSHSYTSIVTEPTCTEQGYTTHSCSECGNVYVDDYVPAKGHSFGEWYVEVYPSCTDNGLNGRYCYECSYYESETVDPLGHDEIYHPGVGATCTESGYSDYVTCTRCDYTTYVEITPLGHSYIEHEAKAPTCTENGWTAYLTCSRCDFSTFDELVAPGHVYSGWIIDLDPTYDADGRKHKECTTCGEILEESIIPMLSHSYTSVVTEPTCTEQGYTTHSCSECGNVYVDDYVPAKGHSFGEWYEISASTCKDEGVLRRDCLACDHNETEYLAVLGHNFEYHSALEPSCTEVGWYDYFVCLRCGYTNYEEIPATGHQVLIDDRYWVDSSYFYNDLNNPFEIVDGMYVSTNHSHHSSSSFCIYAQYDCHISITYSASTELYCDRIVITVDDVVMVDDSGIFSGKTFEYDLMMG